MEAQVSKVTIRPNTAAMVKTKGGSFHKNDDLGNALEGLTLDQVKEVASDCGIDFSKYANLNAGQQRMNIGNKLRTAVKKDETGSVIDRIRILADRFRDGNETAKMLVAKAKEDAKAEKAAQKAAAAEAKAAAKAEKAAETEPAEAEAGGVVETKGKRKGKKH